MSRWRRILILVVFLLITVVIAYLLYFFFFRALAPPAPPVNVPPVGVLPPAPPAVPGLPPAPPAVPPEIPAGVSAVAAGGLTFAKTIVPTVAAFPRITSDGRSLYYYDASTGLFFIVDPETGESRSLSDRRYPGVENMEWTPTGKPEAILEFPDGSNIFVDFDSQKQVTLPAHWQEFEWSTNGTEIAAKSMGRAETNRFLILSNPDGSNARPIAELGRNADKVQVAYSPNNDMVAFSRTGDPQQFGREEVIPIGKNQENFRSFVVEGFGFEGRWAPDGSRLLYSVSSGASDWKPSLWVIGGRGDDIGTSRKAIGLQTWIDKCVISSPTVAYCAVPRDLPTGAAFSPTIADDIPDDIFRVDLATGASRLVATPSEPASISSVMVSGDGALLYYTELSSGVLKTIRLR